MAVLREQIASRTKGPMAENEDWWHLCYDTEAETFFVEHEWSHTSISSSKTNSGTTRHDADTWNERGAEQIDGAKKRLLERANA